MSSRFNRLFGKKKTTSAHSTTRDPARTLPQPVPESTDVQGQTSKSAKDKESDAVDSTVAAAMKKEDQDETTNVLPASTKPKVKENILKTNAGTSAPRSTTGAYNLLWKNKLDYHLAPVEYSSAATWIPNLISLRPLLETSARLVGQSNHARKHEMTFNPYAYITGVNFLVIIQILRAQLAASELVGLDASALSRFTKYNPLESIMIPGFLVPIFESIVSTRLEDAKYRWIVPTHGIDFSQNNTLAQFVTPTHNKLMMPNVFLMLSILSGFGSSSLAQAQARMDDGRQYTPVELDRTANTTTRLFNADIDFANTAANSLTAAHAPNLLHLNGLSTEFTFWNDNWTESLRHMKNSRYFVAKGVTLGNTNNMLVPSTVANFTANPGFTLAEDATGINSLDKYLYIAKENNPAWFQYLTQQINIVSRFFKDSKPMSQIAVTGGLDCALIAHLKTEERHAHAAGNHYVYADLRLGNTTAAQVSFYQKKFRNLTASFETSRADLERNEELNAMSLCINANPPVAGYTAAHIRSGRFFTDMTQGMEFMKMLTIGEIDTLVPGAMPVYEDFETDYVQEQFMKKPSDAN